MVQITLLSTILDIDNTKTGNDRLTLLGTEVQFSNSETLVHMLYMGDDGSYLNHYDGSNIYFINMILVKKVCL